MSKRPTPADPKLVACSIAKGGPIGQCLNEALNDLVSESLVEEMEQEGGDSSGETASPSFDKSMAETVLNSFGRAVAESEWKDSPAALLRGRVDHYNKMEQKWRIVVDDAEIRPRVPLNKGDARKKQKLSLWETSERQDKNDQDTSVSLSGSLQILAYNDS